MKSFQTSILWTALVLFLTLCIDACSFNKESNLSTQNEYVSFEYINERQIKAEAIQAIWLAGGYPGDTIILNPGEFVILKVHEDDLNVSVGNGEVTFEFIF